jgi:hypothetical protein
MKLLFWETYSSQVYANIHDYYRSSFAITMMLCNSIEQRRPVCQQKETDRDTRELHRSWMNEKTAITRLVVEVFVLDGMALVRYSMLGV